MGRNNATYLGALIDEVRITKGEALYTGNFTAPTTQFNLEGTFFNLNTAVDGSGTDLTSSF
jgi:hypothetical protein